MHYIDVFMSVIKQSTVTRNSLARAVKRASGLRLSVSSKLVDDLFKILTQKLSEHQYIKLRCFGSFYVRHKKARIGRNPRTLEAAVIPARYVTAFKVAPSLKNRLQHYAKYNKII